MAARYRNGWWLETKYHEEGLTQREIADECEVSPRTIRKYMKRLGIETREVTGENHGLAGKERDPVTKQKISKALRGREFTEQARERMAEAREGTTVPATAREKISEALTGRSKSLATRRKMSQSRKGENNPQWKGGGSGKYGPEWSFVRQQVRERDKVCQNCEHDGSVHRLEAHHIVPVRLFNQAEDTTIEDAHELGNLVLLCRKCHWMAERGELEFESSLDSPIE